MKQSFVIFLQISHLLLVSPPSILCLDVIESELVSDEGETGSGEGLRSGRSEEGLGCGGGNGEGLTSLTAFIGANIYWGDDGGTDNSVQIRLSGGCFHHNEGTCTTGFIDDKGMDNWSRDDVETYSSLYDFGDCGAFSGNGSAVRFQMLVDGTDALCMRRMEMVVGGKTYIWRTGEGGEECWEGSNGRVMEANLADPTEEIGRTIYGVKCGVTSCGQHHGTDYFWCYYSLHHWDYCSRDSKHARYNQVCEDSCRRTSGDSYYWCNVQGGSWDYCSPDHKYF